LNGDQVPGTTNRNTHTLSFRVGSSSVSASVWFFCSDGGTGGGDGGGVGLLPPPIP
jgi:hypothetical protein